MVGIFDPAYKLLPHGQRNYTCVLLPLYLLSDLPPPPPSQTTCTVYTDSMWLRGGGVLNCAVDRILQEFYTLFLTDLEPTNLLHHPKQTDQ
jgi:hypothetical protein